MVITIKSLYDDSKKIDLNYEISELAPKYKLFQRDIILSDLISIMLDFIIYNNEYNIYIDNRVYNTKELNTLKIFFINKFLTSGFLYYRFKDGDLESELAIFIIEMLSINNILSLEDVNSKYFDMYKYQNLKNDNEYAIKLNDKFIKIDNLVIINTENYIEITFKKLETEINFDIIDILLFYNYNNKILEINKMNIEHWFLDTLNETFYFRVKNV